MIAFEIKSNEPSCWWIELWYSLWIHAFWIILRRSSLDSNLQVSQGTEGTGQDELETLLSAGELRVWVRAGHGPGLFVRYGVTDVKKGHQRHFTIGITLPTSSAGPAINCGDIDFWIEINTQISLRPDCVVSIFRTIFDLVWYLSSQDWIISQGPVFMWKKWNAWPYFGSNISNLII